MLVAIFDTAGNPINANTALLARSPEPESNPIDFVRQGAENRPVAIR